MKKASKETEGFYYKIKNKEVGEAYDPMAMNDDEILTPDEKSIGEDLKLEYQKALNNFEGFLSTHFMKFDYKINACMLKRCYSDIFQQRDQIRQCSFKCQEGLERMNKYVSKLLEEVKNEFSACLETAQTTDNEILTESFKCYKTSIDRFEILKKMIEKKKKCK